MSQDMDTKFKNVLERQISKGKDDLEDTSLNLTSQDISVTAIVSSSANVVDKGKKKRPVVTYVFQRDSSDDQSSIVSNQYEDITDGITPRTDNNDDDDDDYDARSDTTGELLTQFVPTSYSASFAQSRPTSRTSSPEAKSRSPIRDIRQNSVRSSSQSPIRAVSQRSVSRSPKRTVSQSTLNASSMPDLTTVEQEVDTYSDILEEAMKVDVRRYYRLATSTSVQVSSL